MELEAAFNAAEEHCLRVLLTWRFAERKPSMCVFPKAAWKDAAASVVVAACVAVSASLLSILQLHDVFIRPGTSLVNEDVYRHQQQATSGSVFVLAAVLMFTLVRVSRCIVGRLKRGVWCKR
jgi:hypothetical protein